MQVTVCYHALLREHTGQSEEQFTLSCEQSSAAAALECVLLKYPPVRNIATSLKLAVNDEITSGDCVIRDGDRIDLLPPFGGG